MNIEDLFRDSKAVSETVQAVYNRLQCLLEEQNSANEDGAILAVCKRREITYLSAIVEVHLRQYAPQAELKRLQLEYEKSQW